MPGPNLCLGANLGRAQLGGLGWPVPGAICAWAQMAVSRRQGQCPQDPEIAVHGSCSAESIEFTVGAVSVDKTVFSEKRGYEPKCTGLYRIIWKCLLKSHRSSGIHQKAEK